MSSDGLNRVTGGLKETGAARHNGRQYWNADAAVNDAAYFHNGFEHIQMELERLDLYIRRYVYLFRKSIYSGDFSGARAPGFIANEEIDHILQRQDEFDYADEVLKELNDKLQEYDEAIDLLAENSIKQKISLPLIQLARQFNLSWLEYQALIVCLAPELRRRYDKLYAYLQDDIARKKPSIDFILNLFIGEEYERWQARSIFTDAAPLFRHGLLESSDDPQSPSGSSGLAKFLKLDPRILNYLLDGYELDARLQALLQVYAPRENAKPIVTDKGVEHDLLPMIKAFLQARTADSKNLILHLSGPIGSGKKTALLKICLELSCPLLVLDAEKLKVRNGQIALLLQLAFRESLLTQGILYIESIDCLLDDSIESSAILKQIDYLVKEYGWITVISSSKQHKLINCFQSSLYHYLSIDMPEEPVRTLLWKNVLASLQTHNALIDQDASTLAQRYVLNPGEILKVSESAQLLKLNHHKHELDLHDIMRLCRSQSGQGLSEFAKKINPHYTWDDLILPDDIKQALQDICNQVQNESMVFKQWNFAEKLQYGRGLSVLYSGPPGTGKTMSAQVMANELKIDVYKIDLSGVVSKYIGETEKNLNRIFEEAEHCNAILFFDEADALFGKRTEVSDAHDRYANIEVSYLLQKMEEYNGIVILATNLRNNMDNAFTRRIRFIIEFPFPDAKSRLQIWQKNIPQQAPLADDIDFDYLSNQVKVSGANIKNIVLNAAFYAAQHKRKIDMHCLSYSIEQEYRKIGKLWAAYPDKTSKQAQKTVSIRHG